MESSPAPARRRSLGVDLTILALMGALLLVALGAGAVSLYREVYSPSAFVERYLTLLAETRAADALQVPGVALDRTLLVSLGLETTPSDALLRQAALGELTEIEIVSETTDENGSALVTAEYLAGGHPGSTVFRVEQDGWIGIVPQWRFAESPLAVIDLVVRGSDEMTVNGFSFDRRQVAAEGIESDPLEPLPLLVFTPGLYSVSVATAISETPGVRFLADSPLAITPLNVQTEPTAEFIGVVQERVEEFLDLCARQKVLLPTACPFGFEVQHQIASEPEWSIAQYPIVEIEPDGAHWQIPALDAVAHIKVDVRSIFDGSVYPVSEDVPFRVNGSVTLRADGSLSILVGSPDA